MKNFRLLIWSAAICGAAVFTGCVDTADNQLSPMEQDWQRAIRSSYPGYRAPKTMPPAVRDSVVYYDAPKAAPAAPAAESAAPEKVESIDSPLVGTFYRATSPGAPALVSVGDKVTPDTVVAIIEAMKVMNEIKAEKSGVVKEVLVENGNPVEYGQPLFVIG